MVARVIRSAVLVALTGLILTGCGRQVARDPAGDPDLPATGPASVPVPPPFLAPSIEAAGGLSAWTQCRRLHFDAIVTARQPDGGSYLTKHQFTLFPWTDAIRVTAGEPRTALSWQVVGGKCSVEGDLALDVSPLKGSYCEYAEAVLQIVTAPARMLEPSVVLTRKPIPVQLAGQWHQPVDARFRPKKMVAGDRGRTKGPLVEPYWSQGTYFQDYTSAIVDIIWLANPIARKFLLVRGYDYTQAAGGVLIPTKIEIFESDANARFGPRLALIDLMR